MMNAANESGEKLQELRSSLGNLIQEYQDARNLISDQIQAVIYSDLVWLEKLVEQQLTKYEQLDTLEARFKEQLEGLFQDYCPEENQYSLALLLENLEKPSRELNRLRTDLHQQVQQTQQLKNQLMDLLRFASKHNADIFEGIFQMGSEEGASYGADGKKRNRSAESIAINQKA